MFFVCPITCLHSHVVYWHCFCVRECQAIILAKYAPIAKQCHDVYKLLACRRWPIHSSSLINTAYHSYIQATFLHLLSNLCTLQSSYHRSIAEVMSCYHCLFLHFSCYVRVRCNSTSLVTVCTKLVAQRGCLR